MEVRLTIKKKILRDYFLYLFRSDSSGRVRITRSNSLGQLICSLWSPRKYEREVALGQDDLLLLLPMAESTNTASTQFIHLSAESQAKIIDHLQAMFDIDFKWYWLNAINLGMQRKEIANAFIVDRKLFSLECDNETLQKRIHREELRNYVKLRNYLIDRAKYVKKAMNKNNKVIFPI